MEGWAPWVTLSRSASPVPIKETQMATYMDVHSGFVGVTEAQLREAHEADLAIEGEEGVHFERAWLDPELGKVFCLSSGPSKEAVMRVHERAGHPTTEVYELPVDIT
ncbi:SCO4226 family nickel-binding protein [Acidothermaceae bacterium B102]|nr:SCO4226 family nickel-binding protein [Acidothermaceae bacterium B102]